MAGRSRRATFKPGKSDVFERYQHIRSRAERCIAFIEAECLVPEGRGSGKLYRLRPWQKRIIRKALAEGVLTFVLSGPRGLTKTGLAAPIAVWALYDREAAQVQIVSTGMRTARKPYGRAVRIIETNPDLAEHAQIFRNAAEPYVELPARGAKLEPLPAEEQGIVGGSPTLIVVDEFGYVERATFEVMETSLGKTDGGLLFAMGTPGVGIIGTDDRPNIMYELRQLAQGPDKPPRLEYLEFAARPTDDPSLRSTWKRANPGVGDLVGWEEVAHNYATMPAYRFAQMRLGLWTQHESAWMSLDDWDALDVIRGPIADGSLVALGFDGSSSGDDTALWAYEVTTGRLCQIGLWKRPKEARSWHVPRQEVMEAIHDAFERYTVALLLMDPWHWVAEIEALTQRYGDRVMQWNTAAPARMGPASDAFMAAVRQRAISTDGSPALRSAVLSAVAKRTTAGDVIVKDARKPAHIDAAIAAILAHEAGRTAPPPPNYFVG